MLASKVKMSGSEKKKTKEKKTNKNICNITSIKRVSRKIHVVVVQQQRQRNVKELFFC